MDKNKITLEKIKTCVCDYMQIFFYHQVKTIDVLDDANRLIV